MSNQIIQDKLVGGIGRVLLNLKASNPFPIIGEEVTLKAITRWAQELEFKKKHSVNEDVVITTVDNTSQVTESSLTVASEGDLLQEVRAYNFTPDGATELFSAYKSRFLYPMQRQTLPYHNIEVSSEISRTDQSFSVKISSDNGYDLSREHTLEVFILKENGSIDKPSDVVAHCTQADFTLADGVLTSTEINIPIRGIYDIETRFYDTGNRKTLSKRVNKLVTVTPRLAALPADGQEPFGSLDSATAGVKVEYYKTGVNDLYMLFDIPNTDYYSELNFSNIPSGYDAYTLVLTKPFAENDNVISRIRLTCDVISGNPSQSPTPQFTGEHPLVITINQDTPLDIHGASWNALNIAGLRNTVVDGRGYYNLEKGIRFTKNPVTGNKPNIPIQFSNGSCDMELFEIEVTDTGFVAIMAKSDPDATNPWWWYGNFDQKNFHLHHLYIHDTSGEGCYLGYFDTSALDTVYEGQTITFKNLKGEDVTYQNGVSYKKKAHYQSNFRFFRNLIEHTGYDGIQITSAVGEVSHNRLIDCAYAEEASQTSGASIQGFSGKFYDNFVYNCHGSSLQINPIGNIEIYNNVVYSTMGGGIQFLFMYSMPEQNPTEAPEGSGVVNEDIQMVFHNNVIATPGNIANGRNTVQVVGLHFYDNILVHGGTLFSNMTPATLERWKQQTVNNAEFKYSEIYDKSAEYKIGDYEDGDFRIAFDSSLAKSGLGTSFSRDYRGYLNWNPSGLSPIGPYLGLHADPDVISDVLTLLQVIINRGATDTDDVNLQISFRSTGIPIHYRVGETADLSDAVWKEITDAPIGYVLKSAEYGSKTVYLQLKNNIEISEILHASINLTAPAYSPVILYAIQIDNDSAFTESRAVEVNLDYVEKSTTATGYRASESMAELVDMPFSDITNPFTFLLSSGYGNKTIYAQIQDSDGNITDAVTSSIEYRKGPSQLMTASFYWNNDEKGYADGINKLNTFDKNVALKSNIGNDFGKYSFVTHTTSAIKVYSENFKGAVTGNDSGDYKDIYLERNCYIFTHRPETWGIIQFCELRPGRYRMRIFASSIESINMTDGIFYIAYTGFETDAQVEYSFKLPDNIQNNTKSWMVKEVDIPEDGTVVLKFGRWAGITNARRTPLNIVEFIEVVELTSFEIGMKERTGNEIQFYGTCHPDDCTQTDFLWSIEPPTINASINTAGLLTIKPSAMEEEIINVKAVSPYNSELMNTIQVPIRYEGV